MAAEVTRVGVLDIQVCVPTDWSDEQVVGFAEQENPCGTKNGWSIRKEGSYYLEGDPERAPCQSRDNHVHITLEA